MTKAKKDFAPEEIDRIIRMAWEDRTTFDAIRSQFGLSPGDVVKVMRRHLDRSAFERWRKRVYEQGHLKNEKTRGVQIDRFKSARQSVDGITKGYKRAKRRQATD